jgi:GH25 family lysozyme M1 (1,4-beta-N-acetylmuramidase)
MSMEDYLDVWSNTDAWTILNEPEAEEQSFAIALAGSVSGLDPTTLALMIDISHWQGDVDVAKMVKEGNLAMVFPKASDGKQVRSGGAYEITNYIDDKLYQNVQRCYDAKVPCGPYHYVQPMLDQYTVQGVIDWNWKVIQAAFAPLKPKVSYHAIVLDFEEKNTTSVNGRDVMMGLIKLIQAHPQMSQVPLIIYTSISVLEFYPALRDALSYKDAGYNLWLAQWVLNKTTTCTWEQLKTLHLPTINMKVLTPGYAAWKAVQFSSSFILPGGNGRTDLSLANVSKAKWLEWLKFTDVTQPPEPPEPPEDTELAAKVAQLQADVKELKKFIEIHTHMTTTPV